jgi:hypothetical protein
MASADGGKVSRIPVIGSREIPPDPRMFQALASPAGGCRRSGSQCRFRAEHQGIVIVAGEA